MNTHPDQNSSSDRSKGRAGRQTAGLCLGALFALSLSACGSSDPSSNASASAPQSPSSASASSTATASSSADASPASFKAAAEKALSSVEGSKGASSIDKDRGGYEVDIQLADGSGVDVFVAADGTATQETDGPDDRSNDPLLDLDQLEEIFQAAQGTPEGKGGTVDSVSTSDSTNAAYEVNLTSSSGDDTEIKLTRELKVLGTDTDEHDDGVNSTSPSQSASALANDAQTLGKVAQAAIAAADAQGVDSIEIERKGYDVEVQLQDGRSTDVHVDGAIKATVTGQTPEKDDDADALLDPAKFDGIIKASQDAVAAAGGGKGSLASISTTNDGNAYYEISIDLENGKDAEVQLDKNLQVLNTDIDQD
ncbi:hypothetical protein [Glutamicibacter sp.]|uniref:hypothetical protein n=1 Tax=Glutamicibacter sp. TaxID=1931995 RepID=UPI0028BD3698|nr:hypothetical protein [Glutamicibacter sp.]